MFFLWFAFKEYICFVCDSGCEYLSITYLAKFINEIYWHIYVCFIFLSHWYRQVKKQTIKCYKVLILHIGCTFFICALFCRKFLIHALFCRPESFCAQKSALRKVYDFSASGVRHAQSQFLEELGRQRLLGRSRSPSWSSTCWAINIHWSWGWQRNSYISCNQWDDYCLSQCKSETMSVCDNCLNMSWLTCLIVNTI